MLLPLTHLFTTSLLLPPNRTLLDQSLLKTRISPNPKPIKFLVRSSTTDAQTQTLLPKSAIQRIAEKLRNLGFTDENADPKPECEPSRNSTSSSAGEIFVPLPERLAKSRVGHTIDSSWSTPENPVPEPGTGAAIARFHQLRNEVKKQTKLQRKESAVNKKKESVPTLAELSLPKGELRRLTTLGIALRKKLRIGKAGITEGIVNGIHERWRRSEVVKIVCDDLCRLNMKRTHDLLERKTGGLVVWRAGSKIVLYRGIDYKYPYFLRDTSSTNDTSHHALLDQDDEDEEHDNMQTCSSSINGVKSAAPIPTSGKTQPALIQGVGLSNRVRFQLPGEAQLAEEADRMLDGLGPRFTDWWGYDPLPVDADLLPAVVPGYRRPFRLLPYGVKPKLTDDEMTTLRRLGRPLPCHFALGRNRNLQGLASSIVKLWEKCEIAKIAVKRGVQNTNSEMMAEELKHLTGGTLLARDREFIILYRGKDFLPPAVSSAIEERRKYGMHMEKQRTETSTSTATTQELKLETVAHGTEHESTGINEHNTGLLSEQKKLRPPEKFIKRTSNKLSMAIEKREKAEKLLAELEKAEIQQQPEIDKEGITEEERYMLRKIGLRMNPFLLLGRRGVFDGTVENMHLHWKYRELVKIITNGKSIEDVHQVARTLEAESGGILVAVERVNKGYAIIMYRGKNYKRPASLRPKTLLNKRQAMKRSIEAQRRESLKLHVLKLNKNIDDLRIQLVKDKDVKEVKTIDESSKLVREEINSVQSSEDLSPNAEPKSGSLSHLVKPACNEDIFQATDEHRAHSTPMKLKDGMGTSIKDHLAAQQDKLIGSSWSCNGNDTGILEPRSSYESNGSESHLKDINCAVKAVVRHCVSNNETMESSSKSNKNDSEQSVPSQVENGLSMSSRAIQLSNKERLLLRKQALKMKKRPVLAVGRSNIVTGVAKAIKAHFEKHPLAIVNVKGRAKGTSVQEVVFKLEQATGAVLVSQEPSKVILYRGWGAGDTSEHIKKNVSDVGKKVDTQPIVSPQLLAAIKLECGLQSQEKEDASP